MTRVMRSVLALLEERHEAVVGDLIEEMHAGRSSAWLLREAFGAITGTIGREIAANGLQSFCAVGTGLLIVMPLHALLRRMQYSHGAIGDAQFWLLSCLAFVVAGAAIAHKFPRHGLAMASAFLLYAVFAKASLIVLNFQQFRSASDPLHLPLSAAATILAPVWTLAGAVLIQLRYGKAKVIAGEHV
jgi:hypothetical protein